MPKEAKKETSAKTKKPPGEIPPRKPYNSKFTVDENGQIVLRPRKTYRKKPKEPTIDNRRKKKNVERPQKPKCQSMTKPVIELLKKYTEDVAKVASEATEEKTGEQKKNTAEPKKDEASSPIVDGDPDESWRGPLVPVERDWFDNVDFEVLTGNRPDEPVASREQFFPYTLTMNDQQPQLPSMETLYMSVYGQGPFY